MIRFLKNNKGFLEFLSPIAGPIGSVIDGIFGTIQQEDSQEHAFESQGRQFEYNKEMSNTEVQRRVADMNAAGINPILAAGNAASTPAGAAPHSGAMASSAMSAGLSKGAELYLQKKLNEQTIATNKALEGKYSAEAVSAVQNARKEAVVADWMNSPFGRKVWQAGQVSSAIGNLIHANFGSHRSESFSQFQKLPDGVTAIPIRLK